MRGKTILIIVFIFLMGAITGWLSSRMAAQYFFEKETRKPLKERFENHIIRAVQPSPEQEEKIKIIIDEFGDKHQEMRKRHRKEMMESVEQLPSLLQNDLNAEQLENLNKELKRMKNRNKKGRKGRRPPPPPPPE